MKTPLIVRFFIVVFAFVFGGHLFLFSVTTYSSEIHLKTAKKHLKGGNFEQALAKVNKALELAPKNALLYQEQSIIYFSSKSSVYKQAAISAIQKAISLNPKRGNFYYTLGVMEAMSGQALRAEFSYKKALSIQNDHMSYRLRLANLYLLNKLWDKGFDLYYQTLSLAPKNRLQIEAARQLFLTPIQLSNNEEITLGEEEEIRYWQQVLSLPLLYIHAKIMLKELTKLGESFIEQGNLLKAFNIYKQAINFNPYHDSIRHELLTQMLVISHELRNDEYYAKSAKAYEEILAILPSEGGQLFEQRSRLIALFHLGVSQKNLTLFDQAIESFEQVLKLVPQENAKSFEQNHKEAALLQLAILKRNGQ